MKTSNQSISAEIRHAIREEYSQVANCPEKGFHFLSGRPLADLLGYADLLSKVVPESAVASFAGVGNPFRMGLPEPGNTVVDIGCGAGMDSMIAARHTGAKGLVVGVDMTLEMIRKARNGASNSFSFNTRFVQAFAEDLPLPDSYANLVISNGVINLCPDKLAVFREIIRVLKPGGRMQIADVLLDSPVPELSKDRPLLWTTCVAGGALKDEYLDFIRMAGFSSIRIHESFGVFDNAPVRSSALKFGARGYNISAVK